MHCRNKNKIRTPFLIDPSNGSPRSANRRRAIFSPRLRPPKSRFIGTKEGFLIQKASSGKARSYKSNSLVNQMLTRPSSIVVQNLFIEESNCYDKPKLVCQELDFITWFQIKSDCIKSFTLTVIFRFS